MSYLYTASPAQNWVLAVHRRALPEHLAESGLNHIVIKTLDAISTRHNRASAKSNRNSKATSSHQKPLYAKHICPTQSTLYVLDAAVAAGVVVAVVGGVVELVVCHTYGEWARRSNPTPTCPPTSKNCENACVDRLEL